MDFQTPFALGAGVVVKHGSSLSGGDSGYAWFGEVSEDGENVSGSLKVIKHGPSTVSVFGPLNNFTLTFKGAVSGSQGRLNATTAAAPGVQMTISLRRIEG
ncbi:MAG: hypothetical protein ACK4TC_11260 [Sphingomonas pseudosanguinis]